MSSPRSAKEAHSELQIAPEHLDFHVCCLKENEDCLKTFAEENTKVSKEEFKYLTECIKELLKVPERKGA